MCIRIEYTISMSENIKRDQLRTVRFAKQEAEKVDHYLQINPIFDSFSSLARVATLSFLGEAQSLRLEPISTGGDSRPPRFLWDYDLSNAQVREVLAQPGLGATKRWLMERIMTQCRFEEIFEYLNRKTLERYLSELKLPTDKKRHWEYALKRWRDSE